MLESAHLLDLDSATIRHTYPQVVVPQEVHSYQSATLSRQRENFTIATIPRDSCFLNIECGVAAISERGDYFTVIP